MQAHAGEQGLSRVRRGAPAQRPARGSAGGAPLVRAAREPEAPMRKRRRRRGLASAWLPQTTCGHSSCVRCASAARCTSKPTRWRLSTACRLTARCCATCAHGQWTRSACGTSLSRFSPRGPRSASSPRRCARADLAAPQLPALGQARARMHRERRPHACTRYARDCGGRWVGSHTPPCAVHQRLLDRSCRHGDGTARLFGFPAQRRATLRAADTSTRSRAACWNAPGPGRSPSQPRVCGSRGTHLTTALCGPCSVRGRRCSTGAR
jgi:hypothetical protein